MKAAFAAALLAALAAEAGDSVVALISEKESPDAKTLRQWNASLSNKENIYNFSFANARAHGKEGRRLRLKVNNGLQNGFSGLIGAFSLSVNGIDAHCLQLGRGRFREWSGSAGEKGFALRLNFDGAWVDVRFSMKPGSPVLWGEVALAEGVRQLTPVTNAVVKIEAIPSYFECGNGRKPRFSKYARQVRTASRLLETLPNRTERIRPDDSFFILQDGEYDGSAEGRGNGPSATWPLEPTQGRIVINYGWTTAVEYRPDLLRPFHFALLEYKAHRISNDEFLKRTKANVRSPDRRRRRD